MRTRNHTGLPTATMEHGHAVYGQYRGEHAVIYDPRPNPAYRRSVAEDDDPVRARYVELIARKYRKQEEA